MQETRKSELTENFRAGQSIISEASAHRKRKRRKGSEKKAKKGRGFRPGGKAEAGRYATIFSHPRNHVPRGNGDLLPFIHHLIKEDGDTHSQRNRIRKNQKQRQGRTALQPRRAGKVGTLIDLGVFEKTNVTPEKSQCLTPALPSEPLTIVSSSRDPVHISSLSPQTGLSYKKGLLLKK